MIRNGSAIVAFALVASLCACNNSPAPDNAGNADVTLTVVKQADFLKVLEGMRGKLVVADIWGEF